MPFHHPDQSLRPEDGRVHFWVFLGKSIFCYINGDHKQYILVDTIFNYIFHLDFQENVFRKVPEIHLSGAGRKVCFEDLNKDILLEAQNEKCS